MLLVMLTRARVRVISSFIIVASIQISIEPERTFHCLSVRKFPRQTVLSSLVVWRWILPPPHNRLPRVCDLEHLCRSEFKSSE
jgi:hypothetical protein